MKKTFAIFSVLSIVLGAFFLLSLPTVTHAIDIRLPDVGCPGGGSCPTQAEAEKDIAAYIVRFYQTTLALAGILAVGMIVVGSLYYTFAGGNTDRQREGRDIITSALWGVALLAGSYLVLNTINPELVKLNLPDVRKLPECRYAVTTGPNASADPLNAPCLPKAYDYTSVTIPGENPTAFNPLTITDAEMLKATEERPAEVAYCTALAPAPPPAQLRSCILLSNCTGCVDLASQLPVLPGKCRWGSEPSACKVNPKTNAALNALEQDLRTNRKGYFRIKEAFPPTTFFNTDEHYNGCAVDIFAVYSYGGETMSQCELVTSISESAKAAGFSVYNEYADCGGKTPAHLGGNLLHLKTNSCP